MRSALVALVLVSSVAFADWPMARRDNRRTGVTTEPADLRTPTVTWRRYLGGELGGEQQVAIDLEGDGSSEVVLIAGGKLVAKRPDDTVVWETAPLAVSTIVHVADLNGDGEKELVVTGESAFLGIFDVRTGALRWRMAAGTFGTVVGAVRLADLDGDGLDDLYAADNACGSVNGKPRAMAWHFANGFGPEVDDGSRRLWELPANREYYCGAADVVADLDGDGQPEVLTFAIRRAYAYDGRTGLALASGATDPGYDLGFSIPYGVMRTELAPLGGGRKAVVAATNNSYDASINSRALFVMTFDRARPVGERLKLEWRRGVAQLATDRHPFPARLSSDLDGDGTPEVTSSFTEGGRTRAYVFELLTGVVRSAVDDEQVVAVLQLSPAERPTLVTSGAAGLRGYRFATLSPAFPTPAFTLPTGQVLPMMDRRSRRAVNTGIEWATLPLGAARGLVLFRNQALELWSLGAAPAVVHALPIPAGVGLRGVSAHRDLSGAAEGLLFARSDGYLVAINPALQPINFSDGELPQPGIRTGGAYSGPRGLGPVPITARFDAGADEVIVRDSVGRLKRLDARAASLVSEPNEVWSWPGASFPVALDLDGDGTRELVVALEGDALVGRSPELVEQFRVPGQPSWAAASDPVPMFSDAGVRFALTQFNSSTGDGRAVSVAPGGLWWASTPMITAGSGQGYAAIDDLDGDGADDVIASLRGALWLHAGVEGGLYGSTTATHAIMPVVVRGKAGPITTVGAASYHALEGVALATPPAPSTPATWSVTLPQRFYSAFAATLSCPSGLVIANAGFQSPELVLIDAQSGAERAHVVLARGQRFSSEAEVADAGVLPGSLGNATALQTLWPGQSAVVIGSTDGFLYAIDACAAGAPVLWTLNLRAPVGEAVTGDLDGDGLQELLVTAADGFLYGIGPQRFAPPREVREIDPRRPDAGDLDESTLPGVLTAEWDAVPNATGYEWALLTAGGTPLTRHPTVPGNPFIPVGADVTRVGYSSMLRPGARYVFAVRARGASGASSEVLSDGVRYQPMDEPDAGASMPDAGTDGGAAASPDGGTGGAGAIRGGSGCGCTAVDPVAGALALLWLLVRRRHPGAATRRGCGAPRR